MTGRKPTPAALIDPAEHKKSAYDIEKRKLIESRLLTGNKLACPAKLSPAAKKEWQRVVKQYRKMGVDILCDLDRPLLTMYCEAMAIYNKAQETWIKYQAVVATNAEAQRILDKSFAAMNKQSNIVRGLAEQLCLSPVGRARMGVNPAAEEGKNPVDEIFEDE